MPADVTTAIPPSLIEKALDPNNLVAVVTLAILYMFYRFSSRRFELEVQEQKEIIDRIDELEKRLDKIEVKMEVYHDQDKA